MTIRRNIVLLIHNGLATKMLELFAKQNLLGYVTCKLTLQK